MSSFEFFYHLLAISPSMKVTQMSVTPFFCYHSKSSFTCKEHLSHYIVNIQVFFSGSRTMCSWCVPVSSAWFMVGPQYIFVKFIVMNVVKLSPEERLGQGSKDWPKGTLIIRGWRKKNGGSIKEIRQESFICHVTVLGVVKYADILS